MGWRADWQARGASIAASSNPVGARCTHGGARRCASACFRTQLQLLLRAQGDKHQRRVEVAGTSQLVESGMFCHMMIKNKPSTEWPMIRMGSLREAGVTTGMYARGNIDCCVVDVVGHCGGVSCYVCVTWGPAILWQCVPTCIYRWEKGKTRKYSCLIWFWLADDNTGIMLLKKHELHHCKNDIIFMSQTYAVSSHLSLWPSIEAMTKPLAVTFFLIFVFRCWRTRTLPCRCSLKRLKLPCRCSLKRLETQERRYLSSYSALMLFNYFFYPFYETSYTYHMSYMRSVVTYSKCDMSSLRCMYACIYGRTHTAQWYTKAPWRRKGTQT